MVCSMNSRPKGRKCPYSPAARCNVPESKPCEDIDCPVFKARKQFEGIKERLK